MSVVTSGFDDVTSGFHDVTSGLPRSHVGRAGLDPKKTRSQTPDVHITRDLNHVGEIRLSDWSISKILRSDWLGLIHYPYTTVIRNRFLSGS